MPKQRQTCTRCSMRRQKCDRKSPCTRCVQNKEPHLCTTEWSNGYNPAVHRKYPRKTSSSRTRASSAEETSSSVAPSPNDVQSRMSMPFRVSMPGGQMDIPLYSSDKPYPSAETSTSGADSTSGLPTTTSTNVDFLSHGRSELTEINVPSLLKAKEEYEHQQALVEKGLNSSWHTEGSRKVANGFSAAAQTVEVHRLQSLLPSKEQVLQMVDYHDRYMSYWVGGIYHGPSFRKSLLEAYDDSSVLNLCKTDWLWSALLFSILSATMISSSEAASASWGYSNTEKLQLSRAWGSCLISCLHLGDYATQYHIYSVQAIINMHTSEHLVGSMKEWTVYQAAAIIISRGLGLHKLGHHPEDDISPSDMTTKQREALVQREIGRRVWCTLSFQDWLCSTSQGLYHIQRRHTTSLLPRHFDEETWTPIRDDNVPTFTLMGEFLYEIGYILSRYLDDMIDAPDLESKYNVVLRYDAIMRALTLDRTPRFLRLTTPYNPAWPQWTQWARRSYEASNAHKIIMIHQSFLGKSFKDPRYTYSRWACVSSSKTIIDSMTPRYPDQPQWWVEQAFVVTAGLVLGLDFFYYGSKGSEASENKKGVEQAVKILEQWPTSSVATHGIRLLTSLLEEIAKNSQSRQNGQEEREPPCTQHILPRAIVEAATASVDIPQADTVAPDIVVTDPWMNMDFDIDMMNFDALADSGINSNVFFEGMFGGTGFSENNPLFL